MAQVKGHRSHMIC